MYTHIHTHVCVLNPIISNPLPYSVISYSAHVRICSFILSFFQSITNFAFVYISLHREEIAITLPEMSH